MVVKRGEGMKIVVRRGEGMKMGVKRGLGRKWFGRGFGGGEENGLEGWEGGGRKWLERGGGEGNGLEEGGMGKNNMV